MKVSLKTVVTLALLATSYTTITITGDKEKYYISAYKTDMKDRTAKIWVVQKGRVSSEPEFKSKTAQGDLFYYKEDGPVSFYFCNSRNEDPSCTMANPHARLENQLLVNVPEGSKIKIFNTASNPLQGAQWKMQVEPSKVKTASVNVVKTDPKTHGIVWAIKPSKINDSLASGKNLHNKGIEIKEKTSLVKKLKVPINRGDVYIIVDSKGRDLTQNMISKKFKAAEIKSGDTLEIDGTGKITLVSTK